MTSAIDSSKPTTGTALTADVRANFAAAASEISALQAVAATVPENLFQNLTLGFSVSGGALTIAAKTLAGTDPSASDPARIAFRSPSNASSIYAVRSLTAANSLVISNGSYLGAPTLAVFGIALGFRIWIVAFDDNGVVRLGAINCLDTSVAGIHSIYPLSGFGIASSTAEGGAGAADSAWVFYTGVAVTSKPYTVLGYLTYESALASQGVWDVTPTIDQMFGSGVLLPGSTIQVINKFTNNYASGTTQIPADDTIPQDTEGEAALQVTLNAVSAANVGVINAKANVSASTGPCTITSALFTNSVPSALATTGNLSESANRMFGQTIHFVRILGRTTPIILTVRCGLSVAGTVQFNGTGARLYGGTYDSFIQVQELMG